TPRPACPTGAHVWNRDLRPRQPAPTRRSPEQRAARCRGVRHSSRCGHKVAEPLKHFGANSGHLQEVFNLCETPVCVTPVDDPLRESRPNTWELLELGRIRVIQLHFCLTAHPGTPALTLVYGHF